MQQAAINIRHENVQLFPEFYNVRTLNEETSNRNSSSFYGYDTSGQSMTSLNDWEFFCNELEYE